MNLLGKSKKVLIIAPHQDDETIGCGGFIERLCKDGIQVLVVHVFKGTSGTPFEDSKSAMHRNAEAELAAKTTGYTLLTNLGFEDRHAASWQDIAKVLVKTIRTLSPQVILAPSEEEADIEHQVVSIAAKEACWMAAGQVYREKGDKIFYKPLLIFYEVWTPINQPNYIVDISRHIEAKSNQLKIYKTQVSKDGWLDGVIGLNKYRGSTLIGKGYAEAYKIYLYIEEDSAS